jgi:hypothetical protein
VWNLFSLTSGGMLSYYIRSLWNGTFPESHANLFHLKDLSTKSYYFPLVWFTSYRSAISTVILHSDNFIHIYVYIYDLNCIIFYISQQKTHLMGIVCLIHYFEPESLNSTKHLEGLFMCLANQWMNKGKKNMVCNRKVKSLIVKYLATYL